MQIKMFFILLFATFVISCNNNNTGNEKINAGGPAAADTSFQKIADDFIAGYLAWRPQTAVGLGFHEYDGKITSFRKSSLDSEFTRLKQYDQKLTALDTASMDAKTFYDYRILRSGILTEIFGFEDMDIFKKNPMVYAGAIDVSIYVKRNFAPIEERIKSIIAIENKAPDIFAAARANLDDSLGRPLIETAIEVAKGSASFLSGDLVVALKDVKNDSLMASFNAANKIAVDEVNAFAEYLKKEKLPKANNHYALGEEKYKKMLLYSENITMSPEAILAIGLTELQKEQNIFNAAAKIINPNKKPVDVYHDMQKEHPDAQSLIPTAEKHLQAIRQFLMDKKIVTMPSEVPVQVKETPQYARATSTASMDAPGAFEKKQPKRIII